MCDAVSDDDAKSVLYLLHFSEPCPQCAWASESREVVADFALNLCMQWPAHVRSEGQCSLVFFSRSETKVVSESNETLILPDVRTWFAATARQLSGSDAGISGVSLLCTSLGSCTPRHSCLFSNWFTCC